MTETENAMRKVKLTQAQLCAAALSREAGEIDTDDLVLAAMQYAMAASEWRNLAQSKIDAMPNLTFAYGPVPL